MACFRVDIVIYDANNRKYDNTGGGSEGSAWRYTFYTSKDPNTDAKLIKDLGDPMNRILTSPDPQKKQNKRSRDKRNTCKSIIQPGYTGGEWTATTRTTLDENGKDNSSWNITGTAMGAPGDGPYQFINIDTTYTVFTNIETDQSLCPDNASAQSLDYSIQQNITDETGCQCDFGDSSLTNLPAIDLSGQGFQSQTETPTTLKEFITYLESLRDSCISGSEQTFTMQFACLPMNITLEPFSFPSGWSTLSDAQKINFLNSKVTLIQKALGSYNFFEFVSLKTQCLKSTGTIINGHIYKQ